MLGCEGVGVLGFWVFDILVFEVLGFWGFRGSRSLGVRGLGFRSPGTPELLAGAHARAADPGCLGL